MHAPFHGNILTLILGFVAAWGCKGCWYMPKSQAQGPLNHFCAGLYKLITGHKVGLTLITLATRTARAPPFLCLDEHEHTLPNVCTQAWPRSHSKGTAAASLERFALSTSPLHVDVHGGAAILRNTSYGMNTFSTLTTPITHVSSVSSRAEKYNLWSSMCWEGIIYDHLHTSDSVFTQ